jgi:DNA-binding XRE family transcriptional regulator
MNFRQHKAKLFKNLKVRKEYEKLGPEFQLAQSLIRARLKKGWTQAELARRVGMQ